MEAIYYEWSTSRWGSSGHRRKAKNECECLRIETNTDKGPSECRRLARSERTPRRRRRRNTPILPYNPKKRTHTNDTRESLPARQNYLGLSISVSRTIEIASHSHAMELHNTVPFAFGSFMTVDLNGFGMYVFFPLFSKSTSFRKAGGWHRDVLLELATPFFVRVLRVIMSVNALDVLCCSSATECKFKLYLWSSIETRLIHKKVTK